MPNIISTPDGTPVYINTETYAYPTQPDQAVLSDGSIVLAWAQDTVDSKDIFAQFIDPDGRPVDKPFIVNATTKSYQVGPVVTSLDNGNFVVTWQSYGQDDYIAPPPVGTPSVVYSWQYGIFQQIFDANGNPIGGEFQVNTSVDGHQYFPRVQVLADGGYITAWSHHNTLTDNDRGKQLYFQRFDAEGEPIGGQVALPAVIEIPYYPDEQPTRNVKFTLLPDGNVAATWTSTGDYEGISITVFRPDGTQLSQFEIPTDSGTYAVGYIEMVALEDGNIFVVYNHTNGNLYNANEFSGAIYSPEGEIIIPEFQISEEDGAAQFVTQVLLMPDGNVLITSRDRSKNDYYAQIVAPDGTLLTDLVQLNLPDTATTGDRHVTILGDGRISVVYTADYGNYATLVTRTFTFDLEPLSTILTELDDTLIATGTTDEIIEARGGDDTVVAADGDDIVFGEAGNDIINGGNGNDVLVGGEGNDVLEGGVGNDTIYGNEGDDYIVGGAGIDHLEGGLGNDEVFGGDGADLIFVGLGHDIIWGEGGDDTISVGRSGLNYDGEQHEIHGGDGHDIIRAYGADHVAYGDAGDDLFEIHSTGDYYGGSGDDIFWATLGNIDGGEGYDKLIIQGYALVDIEAGTWMTDVYGERTRYSLQNIEEVSFLPGSFGPYIGQADINTWEFIGGGNADTVTYTWGHFTGFGGGGDDVFVAQNTADIDILNLVPSDAAIDGGAGNDTIIGGTSLDVLHGGDGDDLIAGGYFDDHLHGDAGQDVLYGEGGNDYLEGGLGDDKIFGGADGDVLLLSGVIDDYLIAVEGDGFLVSGPDGIDYVQDVEFGMFSDGTKASISSVGFAIVSEFPFNDAPILANPIPDYESPEDAYVDFSLPSDTFADPDSVLYIHVSLDDGGTLRALPNWLTFDTTTHSFSGLPPRDYNGTISISVFAVEDQDNGITVRDVFNLTITAVDDPIILQTDPAGGNLSGGEADDQLTGNFGDDLIIGNGGADQIFAMSGHNQIHGGAGDDLLIGGYDNDELYGGADNDVLIGDNSQFIAGNDVLAGGNGDDLLEGGGGADTFIFGADEGTDTIGDVSRIGETPTISDVVGADFVSGVDQIVLQGFGYATQTEAFSNVSDIDGVATFDDQGTTIIFAGLTIDNLSVEDFILV